VRPASEVLEASDRCLRWTELNGNWDEPDDGVRGMLIPVYDGVLLLRTILYNSSKISLDGLVEVLALCCTSYNESINL